MSSPVRREDRLAFASMSVPRGSLGRMAAAALLLVAFHAPAQITVVAGTYGANCGVARGNKTAPLAETCNGKRSCAYRIDHKVIGDPAVGCGKNYVAEWRCENQGQTNTATIAAEAGLGSEITLSCAPFDPRELPPRKLPPRDLPPRELPPRELPPRELPPPPGKGIGVLFAGSKCGGLPTHAAALAKACNGKQRCDSELLPVETPEQCLQDFYADWRCGRAERTSRRLIAPGARSITLSCEAPLPPPLPPSQGVQIVSATYGGNCGAPAGNASAAVAASCNGKGACPYVVDWKGLGDPSVGCGKNFVVQWRCGGSPKMASVTLPGEAGIQKTALISCQ